MSEESVGDAGASHLGYFRHVAECSMRLFTCCRLQALLTDWRCWSTNWSVLAVQRPLLPRQPRRRHSRQRLYWRIAHVAAHTGRRQQQ